MNRQHQLDSIKSTHLYDVIVIGGGASGLGVAIDAASRGYNTVLFEAYDFAKGTSSRSTKLVHGGVRYLAQGDVGMVYEALKERGFLSKNAAHLVSSQPFVIPNYSTFDHLFYTSGLKVYNWMSMSLSLGKTTMIDREETIALLPNLNTENLKGGVLYFDGQFDDARLAINLAQTAESHGAHIANYCRVDDLVKNEGKISGVVVRDILTNEIFEVNSKIVINATGVFIDDIIKKDNPKAKKTIIPSQGVHLVVDLKFLPTDHALLIPKTSDGRVLFAVPWHGKLIVGTTDSPVDHPSLEPQALEEEIAFILHNFNQYVLKNITRKDVLSVFAGLRPLVAPEETSKGTKEISRGHKVLIAPSGLVTISGGKWTTYRKIAEDTLDKIIRQHLLPDADCITKDLSIKGNVPQGKVDFDHPLYWYGSAVTHIEFLMAQDELSKKIHPDYPYVMAQVLWAMEEEMAQTVEDVLARRIRLLFLDARAAKSSAQKIASFMALHLGYNEEWIETQVYAFHQLADQYILKQ